jgi:hypothetical protein
MDLHKQNYVILSVASALISKIEDLSLAQSSAGCTGGMLGDLDDSRTQFTKVICIELIRRGGDMASLITRIMH